MKKTTFLFLGITLLSVGIRAQTTIFLETFGTTKTSRDGCVSGTTTGLYDATKCESYADHDWSADSHVWNSGIVYTPVSTATTVSCDDAGTTLNVRTNNPSTYTGASGNGNLYFNADLTNSFTISGINTLNYDNINLSFGIYGKKKYDVTYIKVQCNYGSGFTDIATTQIAGLTTTKTTWLTVSNVSVLANSNFSIRFSTPNYNTLDVSGTNELPEIRIDDIKITGTATTTSVNSLNSENRKVVASNATITLVGFTTGNVEIYNTQGKKVFASELKETIQPQLAKGLYIVRVGDFRQKISL